MSLSTLSSTSLSSSSSFLSSLPLSSLFLTLLSRSRLHQLSLWLSCLSLEPMSSPQRPSIPLAPDISRSPTYEREVFTTGEPCYHILSNLALRSITQSTMPRKSPRHRHTGNCRTVPGAAPRLPPPHSDPPCSQHPPSHKRRYISDGASRGPRGRTGGFSERSRLCTGTVDGDACSEQWIPRGSEHGH